MRSKKLLIPESRRRNVGKSYDLKSLCWWFNSAPGHQEHPSRNANHHRLAFFLSELQLLVSGLFPVACCVSHPDRRALPVECCATGGNIARATMAGRVAQLSPLTTHETYPNLPALLRQSGRTVLPASRTPENLGSPWPVDWTYPNRSHPFHGPESRPDFLPGYRHPI